MNKDKSTVEDLRNTLTLIKHDYTLTRHESDWIIFLDFSNCCPVAPVILIRSLPAKSTKFNLPALIWVWVYPFIFSVIICSIITNNEWECDDTSFINVDAVVL